MQKSGKIRLLWKVGQIKFVPVQAAFWKHVTWLGSFTARSWYLSHMHCMYVYCFQRKFELPSTVGLCVKVTWSGSVFDIFFSLWILLSAEFFSEKKMLTCSASSTFFCSLCEAWLRAVPRHKYFFSKHLIWLIRNCSGGSLLTKGEFQIFIFEVCIHRCVYGWQSRWDRLKSKGLYISCFT
jgi:hypothetical protein